MRSTGAELAGTYDIEKYRICIVSFDHRIYSYIVNTIYDLFLYCIHYSRLQLVHNISNFKTRVCTFVYRQKFCVCIVYIRYTIHETRRFRLTCICTTLICKVFTKNTRSVLIRDVKTPNFFGPARNKIFYFRPVWASENILSSMFYNKTTNYLVLTDLQRRRRLDFGLREEHTEKITQQRL